MPVARWDSSSSSSTSAGWTRTASTSPSTRSRKVPEPVARPLPGRLARRTDRRHATTSSRASRCSSTWSRTKRARPSANLCAVADRVLFSSSPLDYAEATHVNVRPPEAWAADFAAHGFFRNLDYDATYLTPWAVLYERRSDDPGDIVRALRACADAHGSRDPPTARERVEDVARARSRWRQRAGATRRTAPSSSVRVEDLAVAAPRDARLRRRARGGARRSAGADRVLPRACSPGKDAAAREYERVDRVEGVPRDAEGAVAVSPGARLHRSLT